MTVNCLIGLFFIEEFEDLMNLRIISIHGRNIIIYFLRFLSTCKYDRNIVKMKQLFI